MSWSQRKGNRLLLSKAWTWGSEWWKAQSTGSHRQDRDDGGLALAEGPWCSEIGKSGLVPHKAGMAELWLRDWGCLVKTLHPCGSSRCETSRGDDGDHKYIGTNWEPSYLNLYMGCFLQLWGMEEEHSGERATKDWAPNLHLVISLGYVRADKMNLRLRMTWGFLCATFRPFVFFTSMLLLFISDKMLLGKGRRTELAKLIDH